MVKEEKIREVLKILYKKYSSLDKTTLNRMRKKPDPFKILISCLLSLRSRDENTEIVSKELFAEASTPKQILALPTKKLQKLIFSSGHYIKKSQVLKSVSYEILTRFNNKVPKTREELISIKGVGPKTANIVLAFAYEQAVIPVDTHCHRISNRLGWIKTKTAEKTEIIIHKIIPKELQADFNGVFVQFGRDLCRPVSPWCTKCPIKNYCPKMGVKKSR